MSNGLVSDYRIKGGPMIETRNYADGTSATGTAPLPDHSPAGAPEVSAATLPTRLRAVEGRDWEHTLTYNGVRLEAADRIEELERTCEKS